MLEHQLKERTTWHSWQIERHLPLTLLKFDAPERQVAGFQT